MSGPPCQAFSPLGERLANASSIRASRFPSSVDDAEPLGRALLSGKEVGPSDCHDSAELQHAAGISRRTLLLDSPVRLYSRVRLG
jgi:hypothetical protein